MGWDRGGGGARRGWRWREARRGGDLIVRRGGAPLGSWKGGGLPGRSCTEGFAVVRWGFPTVLDPDSLRSGLPHPFAFETVPLGWEASAGAGERVQAVGKSTGRGCVSVGISVCVAPRRRCPDPGGWPRLGGRARSATGGRSANTGHPPRLFSSSRGRVASPALTSWGRQALPRGSEPVKNAKRAAPRLRRIAGERREWEQRRDFRNNVFPHPPALRVSLPPGVTASHLSFVCGLSAARSRLGGAPAGRQGPVARRPRPSGLAAGAQPRPVEAQRPLPAPAPRAGAGLLRAPPGGAGRRAGPPRGVPGVSRGPRGRRRRGTCHPHADRPPPRARRRLPKGVRGVVRSGGSFPSQRARPGLEGVPFAPTS